MTDEENDPLIAAAGCFTDAAKKLLTIESRLHAETLIASVARMSGSLMFRSFGFNETIEPGTAVFSEQANIHGPKLMDAMFATLQQLGESVGQDDINREYASAKFSQLSFKESHERLAPFFLKYCEVAPISLYDASFGAAIASAILVRECREVLSVDKGAAIAAYGFVEGTKTMPYPINVSADTNKSTQSSRKKAWYKFW